MQIGLTNVLNSDVVSTVDPNLMTVVSYETTVDTKVPAVMEEDTVVLVFVCPNRACTLGLYPCS